MISRMPLAIDVDSAEQSDTFLKCKLVDDEAEENMMLTFSFDAAPVSSSADPSSMTSISGE
jgi:hypothetical protein